MTLGELRGVERRFGDGIAALGPMDLEIGESEFISLLGPSGCGKSTALKIVAGLLAPTRGSVLWHGAKPEIGFVFQDATLMPWATVLNNVALPLAIAGTSRSEIEARSEAALRRVGLGSDAGYLYPRALSGGMRMRVSIARALVARSALLLMDEPFAALDEISRDGLNEDLLRLWREDGLTVLFVTHSVFESTFLSTRIIVLTPRPGRIAGMIRTNPPPGRSTEWRTSREFAETANRTSALLRDGLKAAA